MSFPSLLTFDLLLGATQVNNVNVHFTWPSVWLCVCVCKWTLVHQLMSDVTAVHSVLSQRTFWCKRSPGGIINWDAARPMPNLFNVNCRSINRFCNSWKMPIKHITGPVFFFFEGVRVMELGTVPSLGWIYWAKLARLKSDQRTQNRSQMFLSCVSPFPMTHHSQENYCFSSWNMRMKANKRKSPHF